MLNEYGCYFFLILFQNAVSMYCRLGFAIKKGQVISPDQLHPSWKSAPSVNRLKYEKTYLTLMNRLLVLAHVNKQKICCSRNLKLWAVHTLRDFICFIGHSGYSYCWTSRVYCWNGHVLIWPYHIIITNMTRIKSVQ